MHLTFAHYRNRFCMFHTYYAFANRRCLCLFRIYVNIWKSWKKKES